MVTKGNINIREYEQLQINTFSTVSSTITKQDALEHHNNNKGK